MPFQRLEVVSVWCNAYLTHMPLTRLLRFLTIFAVLFSPISMSAGHAAMAMPAPSTPMADHMAAAPAGHCADMDGEQGKSSPAAPNIDCMIACSAMPAADFEVEAIPSSQLPSSRAR